MYDRPPKLISLNNNNIYFFNAYKTLVGSVLSLVPFFCVFLNIEIWLCSIFLNNEIMTFLSS